MTTDAWRGSIVEGRGWRAGANNLLPIILFLSIFFAPFLAKQVGPLGRLTDGVIGLIAAVVVWRLIAGGGAKAIPLRYILLFLLFCFVAAAGVVLNEVGPLVTIAGIRTYFKYVPLFLLPFAFRFFGTDLWYQFAILLGLALIQLPVTLWQRFVQYSHLSTGDVITGTLTISNSLSVLLLALITLLTALYLRRHLSLGGFVAISMLLFLPCTLNETKVTAFLLPIGVGSVLFILRREITLKRWMLISFAGLLLLGSFVAIYDRLYTHDVGFTDLVTDKERMLDHYMLKGVQAAPHMLRSHGRQIVGALERLTTDEVPVGRLDSLRIAYQALRDHDPTLLLLGLGIGNVNSSMGGGGAYQTIAEQLGGNRTALTQLLWETGLIGTALYLIFLILIMRDAAVLSLNNGRWGAMGAGWFGVTLLVVATLPYNSAFHFNEIACLFAYFAGMVVHRRSVGPDA